MKEKSWFQRGITCLDHKDYAGASSSFQQAIEADPRDGAPWAMLGLARAKSGDRAGAIAAYQQALTLLPPGRLAEETRTRLEHIASEGKLLMPGEVQNIKRTVLDLGTKFTRLQVAEIAESCGVADEALIIETIKDMIAKHQVDAQYFASTKAVAFNQQANLQSQDAFIADLDKGFTTWGQDVKE